MNLNLQLIESELPELDFEEHLVDGPAELYGVYPLPYEAGQPFDPEPIYIARAGDLPAIPALSGARAALICIGMPSSGYLGYSFNTLVLHEEIDPNRLLAMVTRIFHRYDEFGQSMQRVIDERQDLEGIGQLAMRFIGNPICLTSADLKGIFHVIGSLDGVSSELLESYRDGYGGHIPMEKGSYLPADEIDALVSDPDYFRTVDSTEPGIYPAGRFGFRALYYRIYVDGKYRACCLIDELRHPLGDRDFALAKIIGIYLKKGLRYQLADQRGDMLGVDEVMQGLLAHRLLDERRILSALYELEWSADDTFFCMAVETKSVDTTPDVIYTQALQLAPDLQTQCFTRFDGRMVFVFDLTQLGKTQAQKFEQIQPILRDRLFSAGVSQTFTDFKELYYFYRQALSALEIGGAAHPMQWYFKYEDYRLDDYIRRCKGNTVPSALIPSSLRRLEAYDREKGSELLPLLRRYLDNAMNAAETTRQTYVHRNTLIYRLEKIREVSGIDLTDPDERLEVMIAFKLMDA